MSLYLIRGKMSRESIKGLIAKPEDRTAALRSVLEAVGAKLLHLGYSVSTGEIITLCEAPSPMALWSHSAMVFSGGVVDGGSVEELMTPAQFAESMRGAGSLAAKYRPPGK